MVVDFHFRIDAAFLVRRHRADEWRAAANSQAFFETERRRLHLVPAQAASDFERAGDVVRDLAKHCRLFDVGVKVLGKDQVGEVRIVLAAQLVVEIRDLRRRVEGGKGQPAMEIRIESADDELHRSGKVGHETCLLHEALVVLLLGDRARGWRIAEGCGTVTGTRSDRGPDEVRLILGLIDLALEIGRR